MKELVNKKNISLIINCKKEDIKNIDINYFKDQYSKIYFNINNNLDKIIDNIETNYYSIWEYNEEYKNIDNLKEISINKSYIENPYISVIVCLYNTIPNLFKGCINGLINQTYKNFEVLIINDGSDKYYSENKSIINQLKDNRFIWINKEHSGKSQTLNLGIEKSRGKYIAINDSDDISFQNRLEYQYNWLENNSYYDFISNNMIRKYDLQIFPNNFKESQEVQPDNISYCTNHPCSMFNKENVLSKIPFLFSQFFDSYEDCIFHYICFYNGVKMYYDNEILLEYAYSPDTQVHYDNIKGFKQDAHYKITYNTFNIDREFSVFEVYLILFDKHIWTDIEIEKTLLNLRITSNHINIHILYNENFNKEQLSKFCNKYGIYGYDLINEFNIASYNYYDKLKYIGIISKPIRFCIQDWDIEITRKFNMYHNAIIQPLLFDIEKIDNNTYKNEFGKSYKQNIRYGERLTPLCNQLTEKCDDYIISNNEYLKDYEIPLINNDNIFFVNIELWQKIINELKMINNFELYNVFVSYESFKNYGSCILDINILCGTINHSINKLNYYENYMKFVYLYMNETVYLYEQLFKSILTKDEIEQLNKVILDINKSSQINNFLKKQNKQSWNL